MSKIILNEPAEFSNEMERMEITTKAHADRFNERNQQLLQNDTFLFNELNKQKVNLGKGKVFDESYSVDETFFKEALDDFFTNYTNLQECSIYSIEYAINNLSWFVFLIAVDEYGENYSADVFIYNRDNFFKYYYNPKDSQYVTDRIDNQEIVADLTASDNTKFRFATDGEGNYGFLKADDSFVPFKKGGNVTIDGVPFEGDVLNLLSQNFDVKISNSPNAYSSGASAVVYNNEFHFFVNTYHYKWNGSSWVSVSTLPYDFQYGSAVVFNNEIHIMINYNNTHYKWDGTSWTKVSNLPYNPINGCAVVFNNEIHIMGSSINGSTQNHYKWNGTSWTSVGYTPYPFTNGSAVVFNNEIHIMGGDATSGSTLAYIKYHYKYNGTSWTEVSTLPISYYSGSAVVFNNEIHIFYTTSHYKWNGSTWSEVNTLSYSASSGCAVVLNNEIQILSSKTYFAVQRVFYYKS